MTSIGPTRGSSPGTTPVMSIGLGIEGVEDMERGSSAHEESLMFLTSAINNSSQDWNALCDLLMIGNGFNQSFGNGTTTTSEADVWRVSWPLGGIFLCLTYAIVFLTGIIGNSFVVAVVLRVPRMQTPTNFFIVNLAVADLLVDIFCIPFNLISNLFTAWILGNWICKIVPYLQGVSVTASIDTLIAIAMERYLAICHPMKCQISSRNCRLIILIIWTFSLSITLPWAIFFQLAPVNHQNDMLVCTEQWPNPGLGNIYFVVAHLILCYILPLVIITICYALILRRVYMRKIPQETKNVSTELLVQRSKMKVIKMLLVVVILFALSWLPLYVIFTRVKFGPTPSEWEDQLIRTITPMAQWLGSSNSCINPILYAFFNKKYRSGFKAVLTSRSCCSKLRVDVSKADSSTRSSNVINLSTQSSSTKHKHDNGLTSHSSCSSRSHPNNIPTSITISAPKGRR